MPPFDPGALLVAATRRSLRRPCAVLVLSICAKATATRLCMMDIMQQINVTSVAPLEYQELATK
jgi:hypothetical protein